MWQRTPRATFALYAVRIYSGRTTAHDCGLSGQGPTKHDGLRDDTSRFARPVSNKPL